MEGLVKLNKLKSLNYLLSSFLIAMLTSSCAMMIPDGSYFADFDQNNQESAGFFSPGQDFPVVGGDSDIHKKSTNSASRSPSSTKQRRFAAEGASLREELREKESALSLYENEKYQRVIKYLETDSDKLYYLSLGPSEQRDYIDSMKMDQEGATDPRGSLLSRRSVHSSDIYIGMQKEEVVQVWGKPARIEIAGHPSYENERWSFVEDGTVKQVYFEAGRVHGWALDL